MSFYCGTKNKRNKGTPNQCYRRGMGVGMNLAYDEMEKKNKSISENIVIADNEIENIFNQSRIANKQLEQSFNQQFDVESDKLARRLFERNLNRSQVANNVNNLEKAKKILKDTMNIPDTPEIFEKIENNITVVSNLFEMESNNSNQAEFERIIKELLQLLNDKLDLLYASDEEGDEYTIDNNPIDIHAEIKKDIKAKNVLIKQEYRDAQKDGIPYNNKLDTSDFLEQFELFKNLFPEEKKLIKDLTGLKSALVKEEKDRNSN